MNDNNLKKFTEYTKEEHRELSRKGGIKSGEARRRKREQIEHIKNTDTAIKEQRKENMDVICECLKILREAQRAEFGNTKDVCLLLQLLQEIDAQ